MLSSQTRHRSLHRQLFNEYRRFEEVETELERAMRFYYVMRLCFGDKRKQCCFGTSTRELTRTPGTNS